jgi:hypothetical protein
VGSYVLVNGQVFPLVETGEDPLALEGMLVEELVGVPGGSHARVGWRPLETGEQDGRDGEGGRIALAELGRREHIDPGQITARRTAVICYGANTAVEALGRKFTQATGDVVIPAVQATLGHFDVVFSAHLASYGAMPATLQRSAGSTVGVFVLALTDEQLQVMHATETPYHFVELTEIELTLGGAHPAPAADGRSPDGPVAGSPLGKPTVQGAAHTYISRNGATLVEGSERALNAIPAGGRRYPGHTQLEMLSWLCDELAPGQRVEEFVLEHIHDGDVRKRRSEWLRERARPFRRGPEEPRTPEAAQAK